MYEISLHSSHDPIIVVVNCSGKQNVYSEIFWESGVQKVIFKIIQAVSGALCHFKHEIGEKILSMKCLVSLYHPIWLMVITRIGLYILNERVHVL